MSSPQALHSVEETSIYRTVYLIDIQSKAFSDLSVELLVQTLLYNSPPAFSIQLSHNKRQFTENGDNSQKMETIHRKWTHLLG